MKSGVRTFLLLLGDVTTLIGAFFCMLYVAFYGRLTDTVISLHTTPFIILGALWVMVFFLFNLYDADASRPTIPHLKKISVAFATSLVVGIIFFYVAPFTQITPKTNLVIFTFFAFIFFIIWRRIFYLIFASYFRKGVVLIVSDEKNIPQAEKIKTYINNTPQSGFTILGMYNSLEAFLAEKKEDPQVLIVGKKVWHNSENFPKLRKLSEEMLDLAEAYEDILGKIPVDVIDEGWFMQNLNNKSQIENLPQRLLGIFFATSVLIITLPLSILIAILIKLEDNGEIIYSQTRVGLVGEKFKLYKFRSMSMDAEENGPQWSSKKDNRTTNIGRIIRSLHIDEIPQMWNIIRGDIALVGPRPERPEFVEELEHKIPFYYLRHSIIPGFTGWAQIKFRYAGNVIDSKEKFEYDLYYMKNRNIFMDLGILARTVQIIFTH